MVFRSQAQRRRAGVGGWWAFGRPWLVMLVIAAGAYGVNATLNHGEAEQAGAIVGPAHVIDGDTVDVAGTRIRLQGLAAPERDEPGGTAATAFMRRLASGQKLTCTPDGTRTHGASWHGAGLRTAGTSRR